MMPVAMYDWIAEQENLFSRIELRMTILQAIFLGLVQGLTEFIPVSSTAHLVFAARVVNLYGGADKTLQAEQTTATIAVIQLGTLLAVLIYFARDIVNILRAFISDHLALLRGRNEPGQPKLSKDAWLGWLVIIGSLPVGTVGLVLKKQIEGPFTKNLWVIATMMIVVGVLLTIAELVGKRDHGMDQLRHQRCARGWLSAGAGVDTRFEPIGIDDHGRLVCRPDARDGGAVFVSTFDSGDRGEWVVGAERGGREVAGG